MKLRSRRSVLFAVPMLAAAVSSLPAHAAEVPASRPPATTLKKAAAGQSTVDDAGFIRRWLVLEPISVSGRLTTSEVEKAVQQAPWQAAGSAMPRDGDIVTACQQACPTEAIVFGDLKDPKSRVARLRADPHNYGLLAELGTHPRTTYLPVVRNPNPAFGEKKRG